jgi:hypothetical protein
LCLSAVGASLTELVRVLATGFVPPAFAGFALFGNLAILVSNNYYNYPDFRPMTLRRQLSLVLPFGSRSLMTIVNWF